MADFWGRLERWLLDLQRDRARMARYMQLAYWISTAVVVLGFTFAILIHIGRWEP